MAYILITGGSGLIGNALIPKLIKNKHKVSILSRSQKKIDNVSVFLWDVKNQIIDKEAFKNVDYIIHLAGAGIADKRWTQKRKQEIIDSRVNSTLLLFKKVSEYKVPLKGFIAASAIGYYGAVTAKKEFAEIDAPANDFLGTVCKQWENAILTFKKVNIPTTILRTGIVLSKNGGALAKMKTPIITPIGSGKQYMPWIHIDDMCKLYLEAVNKKLSGIFNAVAPQQITNSCFSRALAKNLGKPFLPFGAPAFLLKLIFGELSIILLTGSRISSEKLINSGYQFKYSNLKEALMSLR